MRWFVCSFTDISVVLIRSRVCDGTPEGAARLLPGSGLCDAGAIPRTLCPGFGPRPSVARSPRSLLGTLSLEQLLSGRAPRALWPHPGAQFCARLCAGVGGRESVDSGLCVQVRRLLPTPSVPQVLLGRVLTALCGRVLWGVWNLPGP